MKLFTTGYRLWHLASHHLIVGLFYMAMVVWIVGIAIDFRVCSNISYVLNTQHSINIDMQIWRNMFPRWSSGVGCGLGCISEGTSNSTIQR
jgi:hypothetical protein